MESLIREDIVQHMNINNLFSTKQHGFMNGRSCVTQLLSTIEWWTEHLDNNEAIDTIYFDFKKAFDTVPHQRLAQKLHKYGISGNICKWIVNFLKDRKQRVLVNGKASEWAEVLSGVPQGSVLGPILFIIYINDLPECVSSCIKLFADDTKLYRVASSTQDCEKVQEDIDALQDWSKQWLLQFHPQKCKVLRVGKTIQLSLTP